MKEDSQEVDGVDIGKKHKLGHLRVDTRGNATFKHLPTNQLVDALQLGIQYSVGGLEARPAHDVLYQDFLTVEIIHFPKGGRTTPRATPPHRFNDFTIRSYAPVAFRHFREKFNIRPEDYLSSICKPFRELKNPGASGSLFYLTTDDEFIIKTVQKREASFLRSLLPGYYMNVTQNQRTLLPKFYGLYCYQGDNKNIRITVMNNLIPSHIKMHEKYDLKGSTHKRCANSEERRKECPTWKDLDFKKRHPKGFILDADTFNALARTVERDCRVLESFEIMDYSFLIGVHKVNASPNLSRDVPVSNDLWNDSSLISSVNRIRATPMSNIQAEFDEYNRPDCNHLVKTGGIPASTADGQRLYLYVGIIDILQSYRIRKKLEHTFKALVTDGSQISVTDPSYYSDRFQKFLFTTVFRRAPERISKVFPGALPRPSNTYTESPTTTMPFIRPMNGIPYVIPEKLIHTSSGSSDGTSNSHITDYISTGRSGKRTVTGSLTTFDASSHQSDSLFSEPINGRVGMIMTTSFKHNQMGTQRMKFYRDSSTPRMNPAENHLDLLPVKKATVKKPSSPLTTNVSYHTNSTNYHSRDRQDNSDSSTEITHL